MIINCLGASNTEYTRHFDPDGKVVTDRTLSYPLLLSRKLNCTVRNYGVGGSNVALCDARDDSYLRRAETMEPDADWIIVQGTGNDIRHEIPMGTPDGDDPTTYYGALNALRRLLETRFPHARILALGGMRTSRPCVRADGKTADDFHEAFITAFAGCPILDFYLDASIDPLQTAQMPDGLHMTPEFCDYYASRVAETVRKLSEK